MLNLYPFLSYVFVTTFTPGPNNILSMSYAMRYGTKNIIRFLLGIFSGFAVMMIICGTLNFVLVRLFPQVEFWLKILGTLYMLYLAIHIIRAKPDEGTSDNKNFNSFRGGVTLQFLNLKVILYGITVYAMFITPVFQNPLQVGLFAFLLAGVGLIATSCWAVGGDIFRSFLKRYDRWFNWGMGLLLVYTAVAGLF